MKVKLLADSISPKGHRVTSIYAYYPRYIHSELLTHRVFSRNSSSSRAMRLKDQEIWIPTFYEDGPGMQTKVLCKDQGWRRAKWIEAYYTTLQTARSLQCHHSVANRLIEPFTFIHTIITATEWENFFKLRCHPDAEVSMQQLAGMIKEVIDQSTPVERHWHCAFYSGETEPSTDDMLLAAAKCARISYAVDLESYPFTADEDRKLYGKLVKNGHASPFEHGGKMEGMWPGKVKNQEGWVTLRSHLGL